MKIMSFGQVVVNVDEGGSLVHQFIVQCRNGRLVTVSTNESTVQQLLAAMGDSLPSTHQYKEPSAPIAVYDEPEPEPTPEPEQQEYETQDDVGDIFDGSEPVMGVVAERPVEESAPQTPGLGSVSSLRTNKDGLVIGRTLEKDEFGYPVVRRRSVPNVVENDDDGTQI